METTTFAMIKPVWGDHYRTSDVLNFIEEKGLVVEEMKLVRLTRADVEVFYADYVHKPFFDGMAIFMTSGPVVPMILSLPDAPQVTAEPITAQQYWRLLLGATDSAKAEHGTLRGRYGNKNGTIFQNVAHGSDSVAAFERERALFFGPGTALDVDAIEASERMAGQDEYIQSEVVYALCAEIRRLRGLVRRYPAHSEPKPGS